MPQPAPQPKTDPSSTRQHSTTSLPDLALTALFTALIAISGLFLKIPLPPPFPAISTQFFFSLLAGLLLGPKLGSLSVVLYILLGLCGLPIFTTGGGIGYVLYPSFGYLIGFIFSAMLCGLFRQKSEKKYGKIKPVYLFVGCFLGLFVVYFFGVLHLYCIKNFYAGEAIGVFAAIQAGMLVFLLPDTLWCILLSALAPQLMKLKRLVTRVH